MKKKIMSMLISAMCLATTTLNSVNVVSAADEEADVPITMGDVNDDDSFNVADVVLLQKWLLGVPNTDLSNWRAADFYDDQMLNVFDLCLMKRALIEKLNGSPELDDPEIREILFGYPDPNSSVSAPMSAIRTALKCKAFCPSDKVLSVDVARRGIYRPQGYERNSFMYVYSIYPCEGQIFNLTQIEDTRLTVNGEVGSYAKEYTGEERNVFNVGKEYNDIETYYHETVELDFSKYPAESSGSIMFMFKYVSLNDDGTLPEHPSTSGGGQILYFYVGEDGVGISNISVEDAEQSYQTKGTGDITPPETYTGKWHDKNISYNLYEALNDPETEIIPVSIALNELGIDDFVYNGRTVKEYTNDTMGEDITKLENLIYRGDLLKYGEEIYITGTPDGVKWTKEAYDGDVEYFGEELLSKYIVDGEFQKDQVQADLTKLKNGYKAALDEAVEAFHQACIDETIDILEAKGIRSECIDDTNDIVMYITAAEFEKLSLENASYFSIAFEEPVIL
ncbi:dockerin type I repeat-containing protein [Ruminococcus flavefaciens]|uniref:dockerin type I repeat-containing protein n=1 Tax=Ruminococcus flavefaciens TaxID=1265 RepID=UPI0025D7D60B|nr:dockerin type I repeat-containing protein [Ruminococcus flavefaciens]